MKFAAGDVVHLRSGSPPMTVRHVQQAETVAVAWMTHIDELAEATFSPAMLVACSSHTPSPTGDKVQ